MGLRIFYLRCFLLSCFIFMFQLIDYQYFWRLKHATFMFHFWFQCFILKTLREKNKNTVFWKVKHETKNETLKSYVFSKKGIKNSQSNMQTFSISPQDRTKILSLQIRRDGTCVKKYFSLLAQSYTWASTSIQGFG